MTEEHKGIFLLNLTVTASRPGDSFEAWCATKNPHINIKLTSNG